MDQQVACRAYLQSFRVCNFLRRRRLLLYMLTSFVSRNRGCSKERECVVLEVRFLEKLAYALQERIRNDLTSIKVKSSSYIDSKFDPSKANIRRNIVTTNRRYENNLVIFMFSEYFTLPAFSAI